MIGLIIACAGITYEPSVADIPITHLWVDPPLLVVCPGVPGGLERWTSAAHATERHGAKWHGVVPSSCDGVPARGEVWVVPMEKMLGPEEAGLTLVNANGAIATWAMTGIRADAILTWTAEHELLHAQGLGHHTVTQHVMSDTLQAGGWGWDGVRRALREAWSR